MPKPKQPKSALNAAAKIIRGPAGLFMYADGTIPPASLKRFRVLIADEIHSEFLHIVQNANLKASFDNDHQDADFLYGYMNALTKTPDGQNAFFDLCCAQGVIEDLQMAFGMDHRIKELPIEKQRDLLNHEFAIWGLKNIGSGDDVIQRVLKTCESQAERVQTLIKGCHLFSTPTLIANLDQLTDADRATCIATEDIMAELAQVYFHGEQYFTVYQKLMAWQANDFLTTLDFVVRCDSNSFAMAWCMAPKIFTAQERATVRDDLMKRGKTVPSEDELVQIAAKRVIIDITPNVKHGITRPPEDYDDLSPF